MTRIALSPTGEVTQTSTDVPSAHETKEARVAREYARIRISTSDDPDLEELSIEAHWLYFFILLPHPTLSSCGVADWRPNKLVRRASNASHGKILAAAAELERKRYALFDVDAEEVLLRTYVRGDELLKNPKMAGAVIKAYQAVGSRTLQAALVSEIARDRQEHPEYSTWAHKDTAPAITRILSRPDLSKVGYTNAFQDDITEPKPVGKADVEPVEIGYLDPEQEHLSELVEIANRNRSGFPVPGTLSPKTTTKGGHLTGVRHQGAGERDAPPTLGCPRHPGGTTDPCHDCREARHRRERAQALATRHAAERRTADRDATAADRSRMIADCQLCDTSGYQGLVVCDHDPDRPDRARRGSAQTRAALAEAAAKRAQTASTDRAEGDPL